MKRLGQDHTAVQEDVDLGFKLQLSGSQLEAILPLMGQLATSAGIFECHDPGTDTTDI